MTLTPTMSGLILGCGVVAFVNGLAFLVFRIDKDRAIQGEWRVSETTLLTLAFFGGWFGAKAAQRRFRHKTRKEPFHTFLNLIPVLWLLLAVVVTYEADILNLPVFFTSQ